MNNTFKNDFYFSLFYLKIDVMLDISLYWQDITVRLCPNLLKSDMWGVSDGIRALIIT